MIRKGVTVINKLGLHARAATVLVSVANGYESRILVCRDDHETDAKSIMGVMMLAASQGVELEIVTDGDDEDHAMQSIIELFASRFGEEE